MADFVSPVIDVLTRLWGCSADRRGYICQFKENLESLRNLVHELESINEDILQRVEREEQQNCYLKRTRRVQEWLSVAYYGMSDVRGTLLRGDEEIKKTCFGGCCPSNCGSGYKLGKEMVKKIANVRFLIDKGQFEFVTEPIPRPAVDEIPMDMTVGLGSIFSQLWSCFQDNKDESTEVIGLFGMGGVGKTTLLKKLNNKFLHQRTDFNMVIWVVVSKEVNLWKIQEVIGKKLEIPDGLWKSWVNEHERAVAIYRFLRQKKFVLLLDDIWEPINLAAIGIPLDNTNGSRIVFTTRKEEVCGLMNAHKRFRVECLSTEASMDLFRLKVGEHVLNSHPEMPKLAETVVQECKGLPLALVTVGGAMANWRTPEEWQREIKVLQSYPFDIAGNCPLLEEIIADNFGSAKIEESIKLPKLESINLVGLPSLKSICRQAMLLPCLKDVEVINCPNLRKLPFDSDGAKNSLNAIKGCKTWWDQLEWDDAATRNAFTSKFVNSKFKFAVLMPVGHSNYSNKLLGFK